MSAIDIAAPFVKAHEGTRFVAYQDSGGIWTIGVGHTSPDVHAGLIWDQATVDSALNADLQIAYNGMKAVVMKALSDQQAAALISFVFNLGLGAFRGSTLLKIVNHGDWIGAAHEFIKWDKISQDESKGILIRRLEEAALFLRGS